MSDRRFGVTYGKAARVGGTTSQTVAKTVSVLMDNNTSVKRRVSHRSTVVPKVHPHAARLSIRRSRELRVVQTRSILGHKNDCIIGDTSSAVVVGLEVTSLLVETKSVKNIVVLVGSVEELSGGGITVLGGVCLSE